MDMKNSSLNSKEKGNDEIMLNSDILNKEN